MNPEEEAKAVYARGRNILSLVKENMPLGDEMQWLAEDLEDALFDLKDALIQQNDYWMGRYVEECRGFMKEIDELL